MFSVGSRIFLGWGRHLPKSYYFAIFAENCMKMKEFGPERGIPGAPYCTVNTGQKRMVERWLRAHADHKDNLETSKQNLRQFCQIF